MAQISKRINKNGEEVYKIRVSCGYDYKGHQKTKTMTFKPQSTSKKKIEKEVTKAAVLFEEKWNSNEIVQRSVKFAEIADEYLQYETDKGKLKKGSLEVYKGLRERTYPYLGHLYMDKIKRSTIQKFILYLAKGADGKQALKQKTQKNYLAFVSNVFNYAVKYEFVQDNPCRNIDVTETKNKERDPYTLDEEVTLLQRFDERNVPVHYKVFFMLLMYLGLRKGEALAIEWKDIDACLCFGRVDLCIAQLAARHRFVDVNGLAFEVDILHRQRAAFADSDTRKH